MGFSRQEYWNGLPFPSPGDLPDPGIKPGSPTLEADALTSESPGKILIYIYILHVLISIFGVALKGKVSWFQDSSDKAKKSSTILLA